MNQPNFKIRFMRPSETGRLAQLIESLQNHQKLQGVESIPTGEELDRLLTHENENGELVPNNGGTFSIVAVDVSPAAPSDPTSIVGYMIYTHEYNLIRGRQFFLTSFFIEAPYRRHGIGKKMFEFMRIHAELLGIRTVDVGFMNNNLLGQKFYKSYGAYLVNEDYNTFKIDSY